MKKLLLLAVLLLPTGLSAKETGTKLEKAQKRLNKIQQESDCLIKLVDDPSITKSDIAEIWINYGTCLNFDKQINKIKKGK